MSWPSNHVPKYRKHRKSGQAIVTIARRDYYLGPYGTKASKLEYDRLIAEWISAGRSPTFGNSDTGSTIAELLVPFLRHAKKYYGDGRHSTYHGMVPAVKPLKEFYGRTQATDFGPVEFKVIRQVFVSADNSRKYVNELMRRIVQVFRWGAAEGLIPAAVAQSLAIIPGLRKGRTEARETDPVEPVPDSTVEETLPRLPVVVSDMVRFQRFAGCRPAEVCIVRPCDIEKSDDVWRYVPDSHKTEHHGKERVIFIGPKAQDILRPYLLRPAECYCFSPQESEQKRRAVFCQSQDATFLRQHSRLDPKAKAEAAATRAL